MTRKRDQRAAEEWPESCPRCGNNGDNDHCGGFAWTYSAPMQRVVCKLCGWPIPEEVVLGRIFALEERIRELESLPKERKCRDCERIFMVDVDRPRRMICNVCLMAMLEKICPDCGGDLDAHSDTCPRSPTVQALRDSGRMMADIVTNSHAPTESDRTRVAEQLAANAAVLAGKEGDGNG